MASMYSNPLEGGNIQQQAPQEPRAGQACVSCRKQKRRCSKTLPKCVLCARMNRHCDYSEIQAPPTAEAFNDLQMQVAQLTSRLNATQNGYQSSPYPTPSSLSLSGQENHAAYNPPQDMAWAGIQKKFPSIIFLDKDAVKTGGITVQKPTLEIPGDAIELLGDPLSVHAIIMEYFATVHTWMPIISRKRFDRNVANPLWGASPELTLLALCMRLIISKPQDGLESQNPIYLAAKRFIVLMEATGMVSLLVLQANLLVTWYEYGQAIYPAAWMSAGWCVRYGNMLGINWDNDAAQLLGPTATWTETEERKRTWWGVLLVDRIVSIGSMGYIPNSQEPKADDFLPVEDAAWDAGDMPAATDKRLDGPMNESVPPYARLCQVFVLLGKVFAHCRQKNLTPPERTVLGMDLFSEISQVVQLLTSEAAANPDFLRMSGPVALAFSAYSKLIDPYSCLMGADSKTKEATEMQTQSIESLKSMANGIAQFVDQINIATPTQQDLDRINPMIMDALYAGAASYSWMVQETGQEGYQASLQSVRDCLRRLGARWRNASEYLRILEAQEITYIVGAASA